MQIVQMIYNARNIFLIKMGLVSEIGVFQWRIQTFATSANANVRFLIDKIYHAKFCETMRK